MASFVIRTGLCCLFLMAAIVGRASEMHSLTHPDKTTVLRYFQTDARYSFRVRLLDAVMQATEEDYGPYRLAPIQDSLSQGRGLRLLEDNAGVDLAFIASDRTRERYLLAVPDPILSGILGFRVNLVHRDLVPEFKLVQTLDELRYRFVAGFGSQWADMVILQENGLNVAGVPKYESIFAMLENKRVHYFPRGINEAWGEIARKGKTYPHLVVEESIAFYYPYPVYFFVNKQNTQLAERLAKGLKAIKSSGIYRQLFMEEHGEDIRRARLHERKLFVLRNPNLSSQKLPDGTFWWLKTPLPQLP